ncbi:GNAT family N-acetyltransferase [Acidipila sp. 4G-K13]|nr:GNAT family N-acetyltransferase [Paracidobacterium acidisoli]
MEALRELINQAFRVESFFKIGDRLDAQSAQALFRTGRFMVAEENGALAACVYVEIGGRRAYLGLLSVDPSRQRSGLGRRLISAAEEFAREMGAHFMDLRVVHLRTELPPLYEKYGYTVSGTEPIPEAMKALVSMPCHFIRMSKPLGCPGPRP